MGTGVRRHSFTLLELVTAMAVVCALAALAASSWVRAHQTAKLAEVQPTVTSIQDAVMAYEAAFDDFPPTVTRHPALPVGKQKRPWSPAPADWDALGFEPAGELYGSYIYRNYILLNQSNPGTYGYALEVAALADVDENGQMFWMWTGSRNSTDVYWEKGGAVCANGPPAGPCW